MTTYECFSLAVGVLTLLVLVWTLWVVRGYARDTKTLAWTAVEQLPRPCVVVKRSADHSEDALFHDTTVSLADQTRLSVENVGTGVAVNVRYRVVGEADTGDGMERASYQLPELRPAASCETAHPLNAMSDAADVVIEYESVAGSRYRTELTIEDRRWVTTVKFPQPRGRSL